MLSLGTRLAHQNRFHPSHRPTNRIRFSSGLQYLFLDVLSKRVGCSCGDIGRSGRNNDGISVDLPVQVGSDIVGEVSGAVSASASITGVTLEGPSTIRPAPSQPSAVLRLDLTK